MSQIQKNSNAMIENLDLRIFFLTDIDGAIQQQTFVSELWTSNARPKI